MISGLEIPKLDGDALKAVQHRGSHLQIIASAGSGKTEVVSQRVADLFASGVEPASLVAFTFTERAAAELRSRIEKRVKAQIGQQFLDRLNGCFIGTIHAYCLELLRRHVPRYETYDILDEHRLAGFLTRESESLRLKELTQGGQLFQSIQVFMANLDVVDNELIRLDQVHEPFRGVLGRFHKLLDEFRFLTYGQLIARAVNELQAPHVYKAVHNSLKHLIVDEYQDINPAQEKLISLLSQHPVELCVVGDDDQSIYQWRGSDVGNIVTFKDRYPNVSSFEITKNRRSRPAIIKAANGFARTIQGRIDKKMGDHRPAGGAEMVTWRARTEAEESEHIANTIADFHSMGYRYRDIAILVRSKTSYERLLKALERSGIPVQPGGRTALFLEPDAQRFGRTFAYLADQTWRGNQYGWGTPVTLTDLVRDYTAGFGLDMSAQQRIRDCLHRWHLEVGRGSAPANLVRDYYDLLADCGVAQWDLSDPLRAARLGILARCSAVLADHESVRRRARPDANIPGEVIGGQDRGLWYYKWLAIHIQNWALGAFEGFEGEDDITLDAVDLLTIHKAKGLEWPIVFVPCVSVNRFPSSNTGKLGTWRVPTNLFDRTRYEGTLNDERRVFYVAMTRPRDWLSVSTHDTPNKQSVAPSPFLLQIDACPPLLGQLSLPLGGGTPLIGKLPGPPLPEAQQDEDDLLSITFSELADFATCGFAYRLRTLIGFQPPLAPELGYGKAVHHVLREVAEHTRRYGKPPIPAQVDKLFDDSFYLPAASKPAHRQLKAAGRRLVDRYIDKYQSDLLRVWAVERPFELHLPNALVSGRADVILDEENGGISSLAIVDYKTTTDPEDDRYDLQLQVYSTAGRREGLDVRAAYVHDLKAGDRLTVDVTEPALDASEAKVVQLVDRLIAKDFAASPDARKCAGCDVGAMCQFRSAG